MFEGIQKKLEKLSKKRGCEAIGVWCRSISNHLYWAAASSKGDEEECKQKWLSITNHVANVHTGHGDRFEACVHGDLENRQWIKKGNFYFTYEAIKIMF